MQLQWSHVPLACAPAAGERLCQSLHALQELLSPMHWLIMMRLKQRAGCADISNPSHRQRGQLPRHAQGLPQPHIAHQPPAHLPQ